MERINQIIKAFADSMKSELDANRPNKGDDWVTWKDKDSILKELDHHLEKLYSPIADDDKERVNEHIADSANILMMLGNAYGFYDKSTEPRNKFNWYEDEIMNNPSREFDWKGYMAMLEYEKICRAKYDRPHPLPSLPPRQPHRMVDFAQKYQTTIPDMKRHERQVEDDLRKPEVQLVVIYKFNAEESRIEIYDRIAKLIKIHQVKRKGTDLKQKLEFNNEILRVFTEFPNNTITTDPRSKDWRINNVLNPNYALWKPI